MKTIYRTCIVSLLFIFCMNRQGFAQKENLRFEHMGVARSTCASLRRPLDLPRSRNGEAAAGFRTQRSGFRGNRGDGEQGTEDREVVYYSLSSVLCPLFPDAV